MKVKPIKKELRELIAGFIMYPEYQDLFKKFAKIAGYHGNKIDRIRQVLFTPNEDGEIVFTIEGLYDLFTEYQLIQELSGKEPYKSLLNEYPEAIRNIRYVAKKILNKGDLVEEDLVLIFNTDKYDKERQGPKEDEKVDFEPIPNEGIS